MESNKTGIGVFKLVVGENPTSCKIAFEQNISTIEQNISTVMFSIKQLNRTVRTSQLLCSASIHVVKQNISTIKQNISTIILTIMFSIKHLNRTSQLLNRTSQLLGSTSNSCLFFEVYRSRVDTVSYTGRFWSIIKHMAKMRFTVCTLDLYSLGT